MAKQSKSSKRWLAEHNNDYFVQKAMKEGYRSRAVYKLIEIQEKDHIFRSGMCVVDLGAAPGGWSQYAQSLVGDKGKVIALDILPMPDLAGVTFLQGDFQEQAVLTTLQASLKNEGVDVVICDMAPNMTGMKEVDQAKSMYLTELAVDFSLKHLKKKGALLTKVFQGSGTDNLIKQLRTCFQQVKVRKPQASRPRSREIYLLAKGFGL